MNLNVKHSYLYLSGVILAIASSPLSTVKADTDSNVLGSEIDNSITIEASSTNITTENIVTAVENGSQSNLENSLGTEENINEGISDVSSNVFTNASSDSVPRISDEDEKNQDLLIMNPQEQILEDSQIDNMISSMTTRQKITQMLMPDFRKWQLQGEEEASDLTVVNDEISQAIDNYDFGGIILFAENVKETEQTLKLTQDLQSAAIENKAKNGSIPLLIAIDQEGGIVYRLGTGTALPGNMALGATRDENLARQAGEIIGRELSALGINVDFAPVLDTNNNPRNPVIGLRSFSSDPNLVSSLGVPMMSGIQSYDIAVAAKHFPGHGDTAVDSHTGLPLVDKSLEELSLIELAPFKAAMANHADMIMTAHIQYPQVEKDTIVSKKTGERIYVPATLSDDIITGIVRQRFGYDGIVVTDAMEMEAISENFGESEAAIMAIKAGVDIVLMPTMLRSQNDLTKLDDIISDIETAVLNGIITNDNLNDSVRRILKLKALRGILNFDLSERSISKAKEVVGSDMNRNIERQIAASAVTIVKNEDTILPFKVSKGDHVLLLGAYDNELPGLELGMKRLKASGVLPEDVSFEALQYTKESSVESLRIPLENATHIIVISEINNESQLSYDSWLTRIPTDIVDYANNNKKLAAIMSISKPYDVANYPNAKGILAVYGDRGMDPTEALKPENAFGPNIVAGIEVIFDNLDHKGKLPVDIPKIVAGKMTGETAYKIGHGLLYSDPVKKVLPIIPKVTDANKPFSITIRLSELNGLEKNNYKIQVHYDKSLDYIGKGRESFSENTIIIDKLRNDISDISLVFKSSKSGLISPIQKIVLIDKLGRIFSLGDGVFENQKLLVLPQTTIINRIDNVQKTSQISENLSSMESHFTKKTYYSDSSLISLEDDKQSLPKTGDSFDFLSIIGTIFTFLGVKFLKNKNKRV